MRMAFCLLSALIIPGSALADARYTLRCWDAGGAVILDAKTNGKPILQHQTTPGSDTVVISVWWTAPSGQSASAEIVNGACSAVPVG